MNCLEMVAEADRIGNKITTIKTKLESNAETLETYRTALKESGYDPDNIEAEIVELQTSRDLLANEIADGLAELKTFVDAGLEALKS